MKQSEWSCSKSKSNCKSKCRCESIKQIKTSKESIDRIKDIDLQDSSYTIISSKENK